MPFGSRSMTFNSRMQTQKKKEDTGPIIPAGVIVGTNEWARYKGFLSPKKNKLNKLSSKSTNESASDEEFFDTKDMPHKFSNRRYTKNKVLLSRIANWTYKNEWQLIDDPTSDNNGKWVNKIYPNQFFKCGRIELQVSTNEKDSELFPVSSYHGDPMGIACHYVISGNGLNTTVLPNRWINHDGTRRGRKQIRINALRERQRLRTEEFKKIDTEFKTIEEREAARQQLRRKFYQKDVEREQRDMEE